MRRALQRRNIVRIGRTDPLLPGCRSADPHAQRLNHRTAAARAKSIAGYKGNISILREGVGHHRIDERATVRKSVVIGIRLSAVFEFTGVRRQIAVTVGNRLAFVGNVVRPAPTAALREKRFQVGEALHAVLRMRSAGVRGGREQHGPNLLAAVVADVRTKIAGTVGCVTVKTQRRENGRTASLDTNGTAITVVTGSGGNVAHVIDAVAVAVGEFALIGDIVVVAIRQAVALVANTVVVAIGAIRSGTRRWTASAAGSVETHVIGRACIAIIAGKRIEGVFANTVVAGVGRTLVIVVANAAAGAVKQAIDSDLHGVDARFQDGGGAAIGRGESNPDGFRIREGGPNIHTVRKPCAYVAGVPPNRSPVGSTVGGKTYHQRIATRSVAGSDPIRIGESDGAGSDRVIVTEQLGTAAVHVFIKSVTCYIAGAATVKIGWRITAHAALCGNAPHPVTGSCTGVHYRPNGIDRKMFVFRLRVALVRIAGITDVVGIHVGL